MKQYGGLAKLLKEFYPDHPWQWNITPSHSPSTKLQSSLFKAVQQLFQNFDLNTNNNNNNSQQQQQQQPQQEGRQPNTWRRMGVGDIDIYMNYAHPLLQYTDSMRSMILDIYIPQLQIALEAQGEQHYHWHPFASVAGNTVAINNKNNNKITTPSKNDNDVNNNNHNKKSKSLSTNSSETIQQERDQYKKEKALEIGVTIIEVPYWWDRSLDSLASLIQSQRPDIQFLR